jgi:methionine biosynthesis protein MetW
MNDNRNYQYSNDSTSKRPEFGIIKGWIKKDSTVIDLGSGDGTLLKILEDKKKIKGIGVEMSPSGVKAAKRKGIKSIVGRIDAKLPFKDKEFDYAICSATLQMVMYPEVLIREMVRVSKKQIITLPNFAYLINRLELLFLGRMPKLMLFGYSWYSTGQIHQLSLNDYESFCKENGIRILKTAHIGPGRFLSLPSKFFIRLFPNMFVTLGIYLTG